MRLGAVLLLTLSVAAPQGKRSPAAVAAFGSAQLAIGERRYAAALEKLQEAISADATYWEAHKASGECLLQLQRPAEARGHFEKWLALRPADKQAVAALEEARTLESQVPKAPERPRDQAAQAPAQTKPSLGDIARARGNPKAQEKGTVYELAGGTSSTAPTTPPIPSDAPRTMLDSMRQRAETVFRPRMTSVARDVRQMRSLQRRYDDACYGKTTRKVTSGVADGRGVEVGSANVYDGRTGELDLTATYVSHSTWREQWASVTRHRNEELPECRALASDIDALLTTIESVMGGADGELGMPPSVYPDIRDEVFARLRSELW